MAKLPPALICGLTVNDTRRRSPLHTSRSASVRLSDGFDVFPHLPLLPCSLLSRPQHEGTTGARRADCRGCWENLPVLFLQLCPALVFSDFPAVTLPPWLCIFHIYIPIGCHLLSSRLLLPVMFPRKLISEILNSDVGVLG